MRKNINSSSRLLLLVFFSLLGIVILYAIITARTALLNAPDTESEYIAVQLLASPSPTPCNHAWQDGVCLYCGCICEHTQVSSGSMFEAPVCLQCGILLPHHWEKGVCSDCGAYFTFFEEQLPDYVVNGEGLSQADKGTVITRTYPSFCYSENVEFEKNITLYLPAGYDEQGSYPLLLMCVGSGGPSNFFLEGNEKHAYFNTDVINAAPMFDYLIAKGLCEPFVAATIEHRSSLKSYKLDYYPDRIQMAYEIPEYILPWLCDNYALCIKDCSPDSFAVNRDKLAFIGVSYGGYICNTSAFQDNFDIFGSYCAVSGGWATGELMNQAISNSVLPINYFYACDGMEHLDECAPSAKNDYHELEPLSPKLTDGLNGHAGTIQGGDHEISTWLTAMFNFLQICFK